MKSARTGNRKANQYEQAHMSRVESTGCVICREWHNIKTPGQIHHIADGSNPISHYMTACLCPEHHQGESYGLHKIGVKQFCRQYRLPNEYYLLDLQNKFIAMDARN